MTEQMHLNDFFMLCAALRVPWARSLTSRDLPRPAATVLDVCVRYTIYEEISLFIDGRRSTIRNYYFLRDYEIFLQKCLTNCIETQR